MANADFYPAQTTLTQKDVGDLWGVECISNDWQSDIVNAARLDDQEAPTGSVGFIKEKAYLQDLKETQLSAVVVSAEMKKHVPENVCAIISRAPRLSFAAILARLYPFVFDTVPEEVNRPLVHPTAQIAEGARLGHGVVIGAHAQIGADSQIGDYTLIGDHVQIGACSRIGRHNTIRYSFIGEGFWCDDHNAIGCAGFAFDPSPDGYKPIAQVGLLRIGKNVHFTSGNSIDRGALGDTIIEDNVQIESLCKIGHNVHIGEWTAMVGHCAVAGSAIIGKRVRIAGKVGIKGFLTIGDDATIMASSAVTNDVEPGATMFGVPARKLRDYGKRELAVTTMVKKTQKSRI